MTIQIMPQPQPVRTAVPPTTENTPLLDERLWQTWVEKNERRDQLRFARWVRVITILVVGLALAALVQGMAG